MRHGSLFSGIGGFDLAAEWMGWENVFHCEWNLFGQRILKYYWPNAESFEDITKTDFTKYYGSVDIISGGFPCQPYSMAGKRLGKEDERHLWPEMLRAIREIAPRFVVGENVRGLTNWNGGLVFDEVCSDLENLGYQVAPVIIPACAVDAPHKRERIWFVAYRYDTGASNICRINRNRKTENERREKQSFFELGKNGIDGTITNTDGNGFEQCNREYEKQPSEGGFDAFDDVNAVYDDKSIIEHTLRERQKWGVHSQQSQTTIREQFNKRNARRYEPTNWENFPTQSPICGGNDGIPAQLDGITFSKWRAESIKGYGNAIVPQVAFEIFKALEKSLTN